MKCDTGGWFMLTDLIKLPQGAFDWPHACVRNEDRTSLIANLVAYEGETGKGRMQIAILWDAVMDAYGEPTYIRAASSQSHFPFLDLTRIAQPITINEVSLISGLFHSTTIEALPSIIVHGLRPGGMSEEGRRHIFLSPFHVGDSRNVVGGRGHKTDVVLSFSPEMLQTTACVMTSNGVILCDRPIPWSHVLAAWRYPDGDTGLEPQ